MMRMIIRLFLMRGLRHGIDWFFKQRSEKQTAQDLSKEEARAVNTQNRQHAKSTKRGIRLLRRFTRF